jgi:hypothetical protein
VPFVTHSDKIAFIQSVFGRADIHRDGVNVSVRCPNKECPSSQTSAQKRKFCIRLDDDRTHCWVCGIKGRLPKILRLHVGREALIKYVGAGLAQTKYFDAPDDPKPVRLPADFRLLGPLIGTHLPHVNSFIKYLYDRGLTDKDIWYFKFGISDEGGWRNRILMPSFDSDGKLNWLVGRTILERTFPKYLDADADKDIVFNEMNIDWTKDLTIAEGPFDLTKCDQNSTILLGSNFSEKSRLFEMIARHNTPVILALDADVRRKAAKIAVLANEFDVDIRMLPLGDRKDVGEMTKTEFLHAKQNAIPWTWNTYMADKIGTITTASIMRRS